MNRHSALLLLALGVAVGLTATDRVTEVRTTLEVQGMHCDGCEATIVGTLERLDGVRSVEADHERGRVEVVHAPDRVSAKQLQAAIERLGYTVTSLRSEPLRGSDQEPTSSRRPESGPAPPDSWTDAARRLHGSVS